MSILESLFPTQANNAYRGSRISLYAFFVIATVMTWRSLVHFLREDSGVNSIASIMTFPFLAGEPDPNNVIYLFSSLWGSQQLITILIYVVVLIRYRNLVPLMYLLLIVELFLRMGAGAQHPLTEAYYEHRPPGAVAAIPFMVLSTVLFCLSLRVSKREASETGP